MAFLQVGFEQKTMTLSTCTDATFVALASLVDNTSAVDIASCFFGIKGLNISPVSEPPPPVHTPGMPPSPLVAASSSQVVSTVTPDENHYPYHLTLIPSVGIAVTAVAVIMLVVLIILIRRKNRELENFENTGKTSSKDFHPPPRPIRKLQEGSSSMFQKYNYKETKKAANNFNTIIG